ncbi:hypothetical protein ACFQZ4_45995 [Catellatospora coxensis]|uniref:hypothetical protein n=1 Tax=Catellatospora coxensis TaxID=310354 RepID=UPI0019455E8C|nr:hypothetical protein [Catellatospora coxensis]
MRTAATWPVVVGEMFDASLAGPKRGPGRLRWFRRSQSGSLAHATTVKGLHSSLYLDVDILIRCGHISYASQLKREAEKLEAGKEFQDLAALLAGLPSRAVRDFANGILPGTASDRLWYAISACAISAERVRRKFFSPEQMPNHQEFFGKVERIEGTCLIVRWEGHHHVAELPIQVAEGTNLDTVGADVAVIQHWDGSRMIQHVRPAIQVQAPASTSGSAFDPDEVLPDIPQEMAALYRSAMPPKRLKVTVPVTIERR